MAINVETRTRSGDPLGQRGHRPRRLGSRRQAGGRLSGHARAPRSWKNWPSYKEIYSEWSPNEKVAMEVGIGASMAGGRALVCMKHVGLNVAADPFFSVVLHRRRGRHGGRLRRRPGHAQLPGRAGQPQLRQVRPGAPAGALRQRRGQGLHGHGLRALRALRHPGALPHHHPHLALQEPGDARRAHRDRRRWSSSTATGTST